MGVEPWSGRGLVGNRAEEELEVKLERCELIYYIHYIHTSYSFHCLPQGGEESKNRGLFSFPSEAKPRDEKDVNPRTLILLYFLIPDVINPFVK